MNFALIATEIRVPKQDLLSQIVLQFPLYFILLLLPFRFLALDLIDIVLVKEDPCFLIQGMVEIVGFELCVKFLKLDGSCETDAVSFDQLFEIGFVLFHDVFFLSNHIFEELSRGRPILAK
jgi:hypothetical protein